MKSRYLIIFLGIVGIAGFTTGAARADIATQEFVRKAAIANQFEIESSYLARERARTNEVRDFAERMIDDHTETAVRLEDAVEDSRTRLQFPRNIDNKHRKMLNRLENVRGRNFDRQYVAMQTDAHTQAVQLFSDYARNGRDPEIREFARETLPALRAHRGHIVQLKNRY